MKIVETTFERLPRERLEIGFEGENQRATVRIDCASVFAEYPNATPALIVKPLFADAYPVVVDRNGTCVDWLITSEILSFNGDGEIQLVFYKDQVICKSAVSKIRVSRSLQATGEKPDPIARWEDAANQKLAEVDAVIVSIDEMDATAHGLPEGADPTVEVSMVDDHKRISFGIPKGDKGEKGDKGDKGDKGEVGATPQIGIGQVSTLPAGSSATASMSGTEENPLLNLGIPQGIQGVKGDRGEKGDTGATGATGATPDFSIGTVSTLPAGSSATAEITGTAENPVLSLGIPQGVQGVQGEKGDNGDPGEGVPTGGITGQVLAKASDTDYDTEWIHVAPVIKNTASGSIASFPDGADGHPVDELKVAIEPVQDLHGYDHPWPVGGGKNLLKTDGLSYAPPSNTGWESTKLRVFTPNSFCVGCSANNYYMPGRVTEYSVSKDRVTVTTGGIAYGVNIPIIGLTVGKTYTFSATAPEGNIQIGAWQQDGTSLGAVSTGGTATTRTFTVPENAYFILICFLAKTSNVQAVFTNIQLEEGSTATDWTPYSNICPISGFDGLTVTRTGKNLIDPNTIIIGKFVRAANGSTDSPNGSVVQNADWACSDFIPALPSTLYTQYLPYVSRASSAGIVFYDADKAFISGIPTVEQGNGDNYAFSFTTPANCRYLRISWEQNNGNDVLLSFGTATAYEPYTGQTYDITLPTEAGTVYGGELIVNADGAGVVAIDHVKQIVTSVSSVGTASTGVHYGFVDSVYRPFAQELLSNRNISSQYKFTSTVPNSTGLFRVLSGGIYIYDDRFTSLSVANEILSNEQPEIVYKLATPITYTLTPTEIRTLLGENNIWSDAGNVSVKYNADTKLYIDNKITQAIAAALNS